MYEKIFKNHIKEMRGLGEVLVPYNFPQSEKEDDDINCLKSREIYVDGYNLILHYNKADYNNYKLETLQVLGKYVPFLPFSLVCKIGKEFLGDKYLSLVEVFKDNRKIYCWNLVLTPQGKPVQGGFGNGEGTAEECIYEGLQYRSINPKQVNFH